MGCVVVDFETFDVDVIFSADCCFATTADNLEETVEDESLQFVVVDDDASVGFVADDDIANAAAPADKGCVDDAADRDCCGCISCSFDCVDGGFIMDSLLPRPSSFILFAVVVDVDDASSSIFIVCSTLLLCPPPSSTLLLLLASSLPRFLVLRRKFVIVY